MGMTCNQCGKTIDGEGMAFCPYCGAKLAETAETAQPVNPEAEKWIKKAQAVSSYPDKKKILEKGLAACPGNRDIEWELLFIGEQRPRKGMVLDFSIIRCWVLDIYRKPGEFSAEKRDEMRAWLFDAPQLKACLEKFEDPERKQQEYLLRLCREYVNIFLEGDSQIMGNLFGFVLGRNKEKRLAVPAGQIIAAMKKDEKLSPEQREQLWRAFYQAYSLEMNGKTEYLDGELSS
jgi:hypothetical protein